MTLLNENQSSLRKIVFDNRCKMQDREQALDELLRRAAMPGMEVGDLVATRKGKQPLRSGGFVYTSAVVVSVKPFVLVSIDGDMRWSLRKPEDFEMLGVAYPGDQSRALRRWKADLTADPTLANC